MLCNKFQEFPLFVWPLALCCYNDAVDDQEENLSFVFEGQQSGERVLYLIRPHWLMLVVHVGRVLCVVAPLQLFWYWPENPVRQQLPQYYPWLVTTVACLWIAWVYKYWSRFRAYLTDRRLVRFEAVFPVTEKRRAILWSAVVKTRGIAPNFLWRLINIGTLEVSPHETEKGGSVAFPYVTYFEDLASYIEKIVFTVRSAPQEPLSIRAFVAKPKGKRY